MQAQVASNVICWQAKGQKLMQNSAAYEERGGNSSLFHRQNCGYYHRIGNGSHHPAKSIITEHCTEREKSAKGSTKGGRQAPMLHYLGFSYLASSFHYLLRKVKAFYNGFLVEVSSESRMGSEAPMVEPYFSIPVLPQP